MPFLTTVQVKHCGKMTQYVILLNQRPIVVVLAKALREYGQEGDL